MSTDAPTRVCPECGTPVTHRRVVVSRSERTLAALWRLAAIAVLLAALAAAAWTYRYDTQGTYSIYQGQNTKTERLPLTLSELRALATSEHSGNTLATILLDNARADPAAMRIGALAAISRDDSRRVSRTLTIGWPFVWFYAATNHLEDAAGQRVPDPNHTLQAWAISWIGIYGESMIAGSPTFISLTIPGLLMAALCILFLYQALTLARRFRHRAARRAARTSPEAPDPTQLPSPRSRRVFRITVALLLLSLLVPIYSRKSANDASPWAASPGTTSITPAELQTLLEHPDPDAAVAARLVALCDATEQAHASYTYPKTFGEHVHFNWTYYRSYSTLAFGPPSDTLWAYPTIGLRENIYSDVARTPPGIPLPTQGFDLDWVSYGIGGQLLFPTSAGDTVRRSVYIHPQNLILFLGAIYLLYRLIATPRSTLSSLRTSRRWSRGQCIACAYPVDRSPLLTSPAASPAMSTPASVTAPA